jgi:hypothetical protein
MNRREYGERREEKNTGFRPQESGSWLLVPDFWFLPYPLCGLCVLCGEIFSSSPAGTDGEVVSRP